MQDKKEKSHNKQYEETLTVVAEVADHTKMVTTTVSRVATIAGESIPGPIKYAGKAARYIAGIAKDSGDGLVEKAVCGSLTVLAQGAAASPLISQSLKLGMKVPGNPVIKAGGAVIALYTAAPAIEAATAPVKEVVSTICHNAFTSEQLQKEINEQLDTPSATTVQSPLLSVSMFSQLKSAIAQRERTMSDDSITATLTLSHSSSSSSASVLIHSAATKMSAIATIKTSSSISALPSNNNSAVNLSRQIDSCARLDYRVSSPNVNSSQQSLNLSQACSAYFRSYDCYRIGESPEIFKSFSSATEYFGNESNGNRRCVGSECYTSSDCSTRGNCRPSKL